MKKLYFLAVACCLSLAACEDVPAPYELFEPKADDPSAVITPEGDGTLASPYNVAMVNEILDNQQETTNPVYFKGIICKVPSIDTSYGNATYYISDDGKTNTTFEIYRGYSLGGAKFTREDEIQMNDTVVVKGVLTNYNGTYEATTGSQIYSINGRTSGGSSTPDVPVTGAGSRNEPFNVASAKQNLGKTAWVEGYIVGYIDGNAYEAGAKFAVPSSAETEVIIADAPDVTDATQCMPIQLPVGAIRSSLELYANPSMLKKKVKLFGSIETYFGTPGLKSTSCAIVDDKVIGTDPDAPEQPAAEPTGNGTMDAPFNIAAVLNYTNALAADVASDKEVYFKGIVSTTTDISTSYNNATFYVSDDGTSSHQFYVFRCLGINRGDITSADMIKVGDEVLMCGKVVNYKGNTPETVQKEAYIVSINGNTGSGETPDQPGGGETPDIDNSAESPFTVAQANAFIKAGQGLDQEVYVKGVITEIKEVSTSYGNATYFINDAGATSGQLEVYRGYSIGGAKFKSETEIKVGDEVIVFGKLVDYNGTYEFTTGSQIYSLNGQTTIENGGDTPDQPGGGDTPGGDFTGIQNGDFESWSNGTPDHWKTASTAGNAKLAQATDAHAGSYAVSVGGDASSNKRLGYEETNLAAGSYEMTFYAKAVGGATSSYGPQARPGYVAVTDGKVGTYLYGSYATLSTTEWTKVIHTFTLDAAAQVCLVVMNAKGSGDILIDDFSLVKK